ncbi:MAG: sigma-70 family RNA polymerase sigma factor [Bacteroidota bacterium]
MVKISASHQEDQKLLERLARSDRRAVKTVYDQVLPSVIHWVEENRGSEQDARDLFQEGMIVLFKKLQEPQFTLTCRLKSFLRIVCRNLWLTRLRDQKKFTGTELTDCEAYTLSEDTVDRLERSEEEQLFRKHFAQLTEKCRQILTWFFAKEPLAQIAAKLETSEQYIKKRKFQCKEQLVKRIQADPIFAELKG